ncbi:hypothetical protein B6U99_00300 [Candidatus Geothermarchaeota archaeon ex4572_27]|nr:MAG: hypothetical protein B6U99_00300 [Candidatus Geothermarchaeota archaeon ex4572_27]
MRRRYRLIAFDMDGTLVQHPSSWERLHEHFGTVEVGARNWELYVRGEIDYEEFMRRDIAAWGRVSMELVRRVLLGYRLADGAEELARFLGRAGLVRVIVTAGIDIVAEDVCRRLGFDEYVANGLEVDSEGKLTGRGILRVEPFRKEEALKPILRRRGVSWDEVIAVGDDFHDASLFRAAGLSIGIEGERLGDVRVDYRVEGLRELIPLLRDVIGL